MNKRKQTLRNLIIANCARVTEILEDNPVPEHTYSNLDDMAELKAKMHELRRDSKRLEKMIWDWDYKTNLAKKLKGE